MVDPIRPYLEAIKVAVALALLLGAYFMGRSHANTVCEHNQATATVQGQAQAIEAAAQADAAAAQREQTKIIQQAALAGARKAIAEAPHDACIDAPAGAAVLDSLRPTKPTP